MRMATYLHSRASRVAPDRDYRVAELQKIRYAAVELEAALHRNDTGRQAERTVDVLLALVNLTRHIGT
jgi:hypothetical protein